MTTSQTTDYSVDLTSNATVQNSTAATGDACAGAGTYSDGTCRTVWPFWVEVTVPLCCILFFLVTLTIVYLRPVGPASENDSSKQQLNSRDVVRTENRQSPSYGNINKSDTKV